MPVHTFLKEGRGLCSNDTKQRKALHLNIVVLFCRKPSTSWGTRSQKEERLNLSKQPCSNRRVASHTESLPCSTCLMQPHAPGLCREEDYPCRPRHKMSGDQTDDYNCRPYTGKWFVWQRAYMLCIYNPIFKHYSYIEWFSTGGSRPISGWGGLNYE